jgi:hypothetical protein
MRLRDPAKITSYFPAGSFGRRLRCWLLKDPRAGYARPSGLAGSHNFRLSFSAVKRGFIFARSLRTTTIVGVLLMAGAWPGLGRAAAARIIPK